MDCSSPQVHPDPRGTELHPLLLLLLFGVIYILLIIESLELGLSLTT